jgi:hypothetical protein
MPPENVTPSVGSALRRFLCIAAGAAALAAPAALTAPAARADAEVGEVEIRSVLPLSAAQRARLALLVGQDPSARTLLATRRQEAARLLAPGAAPPRPLAVIHYEGLVNTDARRVETVKHLEDMDAAALLLEVWQATGDPAAARRCREYVLAWAGVYKPTGNDVNENKLLPLFTAYEAMRNDFPEAERRHVDSWMSEIAAKQLEAAKDPTARLTNRHTKRLGIIAVIGLALGRQEWLNYAWAGAREFVGSQLYADGTSYDLENRDTLTYHCSALRPLVSLAVLASRNGRDLYSWKAPSGSSLKGSVDYVVPFAAGRKQRREWTNSKVDLDRRRAAAGIAFYQPGSLFQPRSAKPLLEEASYFDAGLLPLVARLEGRPGGGRYPTWRTVLNAACHTPPLATVPPSATVTPSRTPAR